jgi:hypothetical protein
LVSVWTNVSAIGIRRYSKVEAYSGATTPPLVVGRRNACHFYESVPPMKTADGADPANKSKFAARLAAYDAAKERLSAGEQRARR